MRALLCLGLGLACCLPLGCSDEREGEAMVPVPGVEGALKSSATARAERRAFDGAPPVIPHASFGVDCLECHDFDGAQVPEVGFAPPNPHLHTEGMSAMSRCEQCHVFQPGDGRFVASHFQPLRQDLRRGERAFDGAPPLIPHLVQMRENCQACHSGPAAREEVRCTHPERTRCMQCHVPSVTAAAFERR